jgi:hypothetical protein
LEPLHYEHFKIHLARGDRAAAKTHIKRFVDSFEEVDDKKAWVKWYLENEERGHLVRHEIYEHLVFPVLLEGYRRSDAWSLRWLARTSQNLYRADDLWLQIARKTEHGLLTQLYAQCPCDKEVAKALLRSHSQGFQYMIHEWPHGILYGHNSASLEECELILCQLNLVRQLDNDQTHSAFLDEVESKVFEYQSRLNRTKHSKAKSVSEADQSG